MAASAKPLMLWEEMAAGAAEDFPPAVRRERLLRDAKRIMDVMPQHLCEGGCIVIYAADLEMAEEVRKLAPSAYMCSCQVRGAVPAYVSKKARTQFSLHPPATAAKSASFPLKPVYKVKQSIILPEDIPRKGELKWMALFVGTPDKPQVLAVNQYQYENYNGHVEIVVLGDTVPMSESAKAVASFCVRGEDV